jgi:hypothetical protein
MTDREKQPTDPDRQDLLMLHVPYWATSLPKAFVDAIEEAKRRNVRFVVTDDDLPKEGEQEGSGQQQARGLELARRLLADYPNVDVLSMYETIGKSRRSRLLRNPEWRFATVSGTEDDPMPEGDFQAQKLWLYRNVAEYAGRILATGVRDAESDRTRQFLAGITQGKNIDVRYIPMAKPASTGKQSAPSSPPPSPPSPPSGDNEQATMPSPPVEPPSAKTPSPKQEPPEKEPPSKKARRVFLDVSDQARELSPAFIRRIQQLQSQEEYDTTFVVAAQFHPSQVATSE